MIPVHIIGTPMVFTLPPQIPHHTQMIQGKFYEHPVLGKLFCNQIHENEDGKPVKISCSVMDNKLRKI